MSSNLKDNLLEVIMAAMPITLVVTLLQVLLISLPMALFIRFLLGSLYFCKASRSVFCPWVKSPAPNWPSRPPSPSFC